MWNGKVEILLNAVITRPTLYDEIRDNQLGAIKLELVKKAMDEGRPKSFQYMKMGV